MPYIQIQKNVLCKRIIACGYIRCKLIQSKYYWFTPDMCAYIESQMGLVIFRYTHIFPQFWKVQETQKWFLWTFCLYDLGLAVKSHYYYKIWSKPGLACNGQKV